LHLRKSTWGAIQPLSRDGGSENLYNPIICPTSRGQR